MQGMATRRASHAKAVAGLGAHPHSSPTAKNAKDQQQEEDGTSKELNRMVIDLPEVFKCSTINKKVEQRLLEKPIAVPGCGLPPSFKKVFDQKAATLPLGSLAHPIRERSPRRSRARRDVSRPCARCG